MRGDEGVGEGDGFGEEREDECAEGGWGCGGVAGLVGGEEEVANSCQSNKELGSLSTYTPSPLPATTANMLNVRT